jgi:hypothetical protein
MVSTFLYFVPRNSETLDLVVSRQMMTSGLSGGVPHRFESREPPSSRPIRFNALRTRSPPAGLRKVPIGRLGKLTITTVNGDNLRGPADGERTFEGRV